jgi:hypothetical protein
MLGVTAPLELSTRSNVGDLSANKEQIDEPPEKRPYLAFLHLDFGHPFESAHCLLCVSIWVGKAGTGKEDQTGH